MSTDNGRTTSGYIPDGLRHFWESAGPTILKVLAIAAVIIPLYYGLIERPPWKSQVPLALRLSSFSSIIPTALGIWFLKRLTLELRILLLFICTAWLVEMLTVMYSAQFDPNYVILHIYTFIEFGLLMLVFALWQTRDKFRRILAYTVPVIVVALIYLKFWRAQTQSQPMFDDIAMTIESVVLIAAALLTLVELTSENITFVLSNPRFWVISAVLLYFAGNIVIFALSHRVLGDANSVRVIVWTVQSALNVIANLFYAYAFLCQLRLTRSSHSPETPRTRPT